MNAIRLTMVAKIFSGLVLGSLVRAVINRWYTGPELFLDFGLTVGELAYWMVALPCVLWLLWFPRRALALHEAGHAVAAWFDPTVGHVEHAVIQRLSGEVCYSGTSTRDMSERELRASLVIGLCGMTAEERFHGKMHPGSLFSDLYKCHRDAFIGAYRTGIAFETLLKDALTEARKTVAERWDQIESLATELERKGKLRTHDIEKILGPRLV